MTLTDQRPPWWYRLFRTVVISIGVLWLLGWGCVEHALWQRDQPECPEDGRVRSNSEMFSEGLRFGASNGVFGPSIRTPEDLFERDPDCCFLYSRGYPHESIWETREPYVSEIRVYVDSADDSVPASASSSGRPYYRHEISISRCGEHLWTSGSPTNGKPSNISQLRSFGVVRYED